MSEKRNCPLIDQPLRTPHYNKSSHSGNFYLVLPIQAVLKYFKTNTLKEFIEGENQNTRKFVLILIGVL